MSERQSAPSQMQNPVPSPEQRSRVDPTPGPYSDPKYPDPKQPPKDQAPDPCEDPKPPRPEPEPCPETPSKPCPEPRACPEPPKKPCPEPAQEESCAQETPVDMTTQASSPGTVADSPAKPDTPAAQVALLRKRLEEELRELQKFEPLKASAADLGQRIQALEKTVEGETAAAAAYRDFYQKIAVYRSEIDCSIPTVRCQLVLTEGQKDCIRKAIATVEAKVKKAKTDRDIQRAAVLAKEKQHQDAERALEWAKKWYEFFKSGLQQRAGKQCDELKALKGLADPSKDQCEAWFYLDEMETILRSAHDGPDTSDACYQDDLTLATFLDCWAPPCYEQAYKYWIVTFNDAENAEKVAKSALAEARKLAADLEKLAKEAETKRREWILKELKAMNCCGPNAKSA